MMKISLALVVLSVLFSLLIAQEILVLIAVHDERSPHRLPLVRRARIARTRGDTFDTRTPIEVVQDYRRAGVMAVPVIAPHYFLEFGGRPSINGKEVLPLAGISNAPTVYCNESGEYLTYQSDSHGFHNPTALGAPADMVLLGDSLVHGACVATHENIAGFLGEQHRVRNLGFSRSGPLHHWAVFREYAEPGPKHVVWFHTEENDLYDLEEELKDPILSQYLRPDFSQGLSLIQPQLDEALHRLREKIVDVALVPKPPAKISWKERLQLLPLIDEIKGRWGWTGIPDRPLGRPASPEALAAFEKILGTAEAAIRRQNAQMIFVYLPEWNTFNHSSKRPDKEQVLEIVSRYKIPLIDMEKNFRADSNPKRFFPFELPGHYNEEGYWRVAEEIERLISSPTETSQTHSQSG